jgi:hypothetical protein
MSENDPFAVIDENRSVIGSLEEEHFLPNVVLQDYNWERCSRLSDSSDPFRVGSRETDGFRRQVNDRKSSILRTIRGLRGEVLLPTEIHSTASAIENLVSQYIGLELRMHYDLLSGDLFKLKRTIEIKDAKVMNDAYGRPETTPARFEIPLFFSVGLSGESSGDHMVHYNFRTEDSNYNYGCTIDSEIPPITVEAKVKAREFRKRYMDTFSRALDSEIVGPLIHSDLETGRADPKLKMYWIPKSSELRINAEAFDKDPLLVAHVYNMPFLIHRWDIKEEEPLEHYIAEFTEVKAGELL